ncbi:MAG: CPBP family intramembrane glutamic endopeptidase [Chitinophagaceae bacterium]
MTNFIIYYIYAYSFFVLIYLYYRISRKLCIDQRFISIDQIVYLNQRHLLANLIMSLAIIASAFQAGTEVKYFFFNWNENYTGLTYVFFFLAFSLSAFSAKNEIKVNAYSLIRKEKIFYLLIRVLFLVGYEFYFRIVLLQAFYFLPIAYAVVINVILYSAAHAFSGKKEMIGSVPFGFALCLLTIIHQSVWPAIMLHIILCLPYESLKLYATKFTNKTIRI